MHERRHVRLAPRNGISAATGLLAFALVVACQGTERPLAPPLDGRHLSQSSAGDDRDSDGRDGGLQGSIVFHSSRRSGPTIDFDIFVMDADGSNQRRVLRNLASDVITDEFDPTWSPDGKQIGFASFGGPKWGVFVMNSDGTRVRHVSENAFGPIWSPDGRTIAFSAFRDGVNGIYLIDADLSGPIELLMADPFLNLATAWSPDGKKIAFSSFRDLSDLELFTVDVQTKQVRRLTDNLVHDEGDHAGWSPDGRRFVFSRRRLAPTPEDPAGGDLDIYVMDATGDADGSRARNLTSHAAEDDDPFWSPDGRHIAFHSTRDGGDEDIFVMRSNGSGVRALTRNGVDRFGKPIFDAVPAWTKHRVDGPCGDDEDSDCRDDGRRHDK